MEKGKIIYYQDLLHCVKKNSFNIKFEDIMTFLAKSGFFYNKEASTTDIENVWYDDYGNIRDSWKFVFENKDGTKITFDPTLGYGMPSSLSICLEYPIVDDFFQADEFIYMDNEKFNEQEKRYINHTPFENERREHKKHEEEKKEKREAEKILDELKKIYHAEKEIQLMYIHKLILWHKYTFLKNKKNYLHQLENGTIKLYYLKRNGSSYYNAIKLSVNLDTKESEPFTFKKYGAVRCNIDNYSFLYKTTSEELLEHDEAYKLLYPWNCY